MLTIDRTQRPNILEEDVQECSVDARPFMSRDENGVVVPLVERLTFAIDLCRSRSRQCSR